MTDGKNGCYLCQSNNWQIITDKLRHGIERKVYKCQDCGLVFLEPLPQQEEYYRGDYRKLYTPVLGQEVDSEGVYKMYSPYQHFRINDLRKILGKDCDLLDVGCSSGAFLDSVRSLVNSCEGIELNTKDAEFVGDQLKLKVYNEPIETAKLKDGGYDVITAFQVLEHVDNPLLFLDQIKKNLKPGGYIAIEVPNIDDWLLTVFKVPGYRDFYYREPHLFYYSPETLVKLMNKAGFEGEVIHSSFDSNLANQLNWIFANKPQPDAACVYGDQVLPFVDEVAESLKAKVYELFDDFDKKYRDFIATHKIGRSILFIGKKI